MTVIGEGGGGAYFRGGTYFLDSVASVEKGAYFRGGRLLSRLYGIIYNFVDTPRIFMR